MRIRKTFQSSMTEGRVINTKSDSVSDAYSCDYTNKQVNEINDKIDNLKRYSLFSGDSNTSVSLSDDASNYKFLEIIYRTNDGGGYKSSSGLISSPNGCIVSLTYFHYNGTLYVKQAQASISGRTITLNNQIEWYFNSGGTPSIGSSRNIYIKDVIGYK